MKLEEGLAAADVPALAVAGTAAGLPVAAPAPDWGEWMGAALRPVGLTVWA